MVILLAGGGSGGHTTPLLAVADSLRQQGVQDLRIVHIGQTGDQLDSVMQHSSIDESIGITAGKFRRYNGESLLSHILDTKTIALNVRDFFRFVRGTFQAIRILRARRPDAILLKGGYVCVPVGIAARLLRIKYMTHDSDAIPGLANRITAGGAVYNAVAMPVESYPYDRSKVVQTGIPIRPEFSKVTVDQQKQAKKQLGLQPTDRMLFVVGGGLGARNINVAVAGFAKSLLLQDASLRIVQVTGKSLYDETQALYADLDDTLQGRVQLLDFVSDIHVYTAAADAVISRAGATNLAEFAVQNKAIILVPNPVLTGGQQLHNAKLVADANAAIVVQEGASDDLRAAVDELLSMSQNQKSAMGAALEGVLHSQNASDKIAQLLLTMAKK